MSAASPVPAPDSAAEIARLIEVIGAASERLRELQGAAAGRSSARQGKTRPREAKHQVAASGVLPAHIAALDAKGAIVSVNASWSRFGDENGLTTLRHGLGCNYLAACDAVSGPDSADAAAAAAGIRSILSGEANSFALEYRCDSPTHERWFLLNASAVAGSPAGGAMVMHSDITLRVQTARALAALSLTTERRERMLSTALSSITDFAYIIDAHGRLMFANQKILDRWGMGLDEAVGKSSYDLGYPRHVADKFHAQIQSVFATGKAVKDEVSAVDPAGVAGFYEYVFSPALAPDGSVDFVVGCTRDITERKRSDLALQESVAEFRTLAAALPQIVWVTTPQRKATYLNQQWMDYTGLSREEGLGGGFARAVHPDDQARASQAFDRSSNGAYSYEARLRRADGVYRWWLVRAVSLADDQGAVLKWIGTCTDIDDLKLAEIEVSRTNRELQRQRTELRTLLDLVPAMIWFKDTSNMILRVNERGAKSLGRTVSQVEGACIADVYPAETAARYLASDQVIIRTGLPILGMLEQETDASGGEVWIQKDKVPYRDEGGQVVGIVVIAHDITERKRDQDALRELNAELEDRVRSRTAELNLARDDAESANRAKSDFLATMSHEIRTPMSGLLGLLELLALGSLDQEQRSTLALTRDSGTALMQIIDDILDFSKIEASSLELNLVGASVQTVITNVCRLHEQVASSKNLTLRADISPQISPWLSFDPLRLGQILNNFVNNAIKFTAAGHVHISVQPVGRRDDMEELRFTVHDTGIGMTPQQMSRLFQPFVQASAETSARFGGTGLGLVISRRLAELMGGTVKVESEPGVGTTLSLTLAFEICEATGPGPSELADQDALVTLTAGRRCAPSIEEAQADGTLLLIVDDHPTNRLVLMRQAASLGYASEAANDGAQALQAWRSGRFAAVITDCNMPTLNGYELATAIREAECRQGGARIPIIACTANALPEAADFCLSVGMDDCLVKPVGLAHVSAILDRWVPIPRDGAAASGAVAPAPPQRLGLMRGEGMLDLVLLAEISGGDQMAQVEMLLDFRRVNETDAAALRAASALGDFAGVTGSSHRIKGASLMLGATLLAEVCGRIEAAAAARDAPGLLAAMSSFETELLRLNRYLEMFPTLRLEQG